MVGGLGICHNEFCIMNMYIILLYILWLFKQGVQCYIKEQEQWTKTSRLGLWSDLPVNSLISFSKSLNLPIVLLRDLDIISL